MDNRTGDIARIAGVSPACVSNYKAGRLEKVGKTATVKIENALKGKSETTATDLIRTALLRGEIVGFDDARRMHSARLSDVIEKYRRWIELRIPNILAEKHPHAWHYLDTVGETAVPNCDKWHSDRGIITLSFRAGRLTWGKYFMVPRVAQFLQSERTQSPAIYGTGTDAESDEC